MKKEGRQHSVVRSYPIHSAPLSQQRKAINVDPASGSKVSRKPTNQPKFNGKYGTPRYAGYRIYTASKSNDKAKGTMKSMSIAYDHKMIECPIGASTADALAYLASYISYCDGDEYEGRNDKYQGDYD
ncbi:hypothetical protein CTI12_AA182370 [Artemisia annua]|uniref:Uncharacterized protein n=1 Tax=Artemisia annua TaxID=35608 RepID=A0A2U1P805_ARTAN|nr:hypothetical protein CTI12_AA182370 [Artemisia annua]